jgi:hypothetical protein
MYQGKVMEYDAISRVGTIQLLGSDQTVQFIVENGRHIVAGQNEPEFSTGKVLRRPRRGDKVVMICDNRFAQSALWGYADNYSKAMRHIAARPLYRYMVQFWLLKDLPFNDPVQVFCGSLVELSRCFLGLYLARTVNCQNVPRGILVTLKTFWEKSQDKGMSWEECEDPRHLG